MAKQTNSDFEPQVRFNWGFHDGAAARQYRHSHFDKFYLAGHQAGYNAKGNQEPIDSSLAAWKTYKARPTNKFAPNHR